MKHLRLVTIALAMGLALSSTACLAVDMKQLSSGGMTVSYPPGMDAQAKKVMAIWQSSVKPSIDIQRQTVTLLTDTDGMSKDIAAMLGADDKQPLIKTRLDTFKSKAQALIAAFSSVKLVSKGTAVATGGVDACLVQLRYIKDKDEFTLIVDQQDVTPDKLKKTFFPVIVNADGSIRSESKLSTMALDFLGSGDGLAVAPVHDTVAYMLAEQLKIYHPMARWFNEGVSGYITRQMVSKYCSKLNSIANSLFSVSDKAKQVRPQINLLAWAQMPYQNRDKKTFDPVYEVASTQFSIEVISNLLAKANPKTLPKIVSEVSHVGNPDTETICAAVKKVANTDLKAVLMTYVPQDVQDGINSGQAPKLVVKAQGLVDQKKWQDAAATLKQALSMDPGDVNARMNLAWIEREYDERHDAELQIFLTAALLKQEKYTFHFYKNVIEGDYVLGRFAIMMGDLQTAKQCISTVLQFKPNHADAKRAMDEITKLEAAAKGTP